MKIAEMLEAAKSRRGYRGDTDEIREARQAVEDARRELRRLVRARGGSISGDQPRRGFAALGREVARAAALKRWGKQNTSTRKENRHGTE